MEPPIHNNLRNQSRRSMTASSIWKSLRKKYVLLCCLCGGLCVALGILYLVIYFVLGKYTSSMHYFQTMPLYIPSIVVSTYIVLFLEEKSDPKKICNKNFVNLNHFCSLHKNFHCILCIKGIFDCMIYICEVYFFFASSFWFQSVPKWLMHCSFNGVHFVRTLSTF